MIDDCVFILINLHNSNTKKEQVSTWEKLNLILQIFDYLKNKIIILGGNFNLFLDSILETEGGIKKFYLCYLISLQFPFL